MSKIAVDTNFIISLIIQRDVTETASELLNYIVSEYDEIYLSKQVVAETVYVLEGIHKYNPNIKKISKKEIIDFITSIINTPKFKCEQEQEILMAVEFYINKNISFGDSLISANILSQGIDRIVSFDNHFEKIQNLKVIKKL